MKDDQLMREINALKILIKNLQDENDKQQEILDNLLKEYNDRETKIHCNYL